jgi:uncharacterized membrane protein
LIKLSVGFKRFPESLLAATAMVVALICLNHLDYQDQTGFYHSINRVAMILALGIPVYLIVRLCFERKPGLKYGVKTALYHGALSGLIVYYYYGINNFTMVAVTRYYAVTIAAYLAWGKNPKMKSLVGVFIHEIRNQSN